MWWGDETVMCDDLLWCWHVQQQQQPYHVCAFVCVCLIWCISYNVPVPTPWLMEVMVRNVELVEVVMTVTVMMHFWGLAVKSWSLGSHWDDISCFGIELTRWLQSDDDDYDKDDDCYIIKIFPEQVLTLAVVILSMQPAFGRLLRLGLLCRCACLCVVRSTWWVKLCRVELLLLRCFSSTLQMVKMVMVVPKVGMV